jgi:hypothetical protein
MTMTTKRCPTCGAVSVTRHADVRGSRNPAAKLTEANVVAVRAASRRRASGAASE